MCWNVVLNKLITTKGRNTDESASQKCYLITVTVKPKSLITLRAGVTPGSQDRFARSVCQWVLFKITFSGRQFVNKHMALLNSILGERSYNKIHEHERIVTFVAVIKHTVHRI